MARVKLPDTARRRQPAHSLDTAKLDDLTLILKQLRLESEELLQADTGLSAARALLQALLHHPEFTAPVRTTDAGKKHSAFDCFGKAERKRSRAGIMRQMEDDRRSWDERT